MRTGARLAGDDADPYGEGHMIPDELRNLYPKLSDDELAAVMENIDQFILLAWEIVEDASTAPPIDSGEDDR